MIINVMSLYTILRQYSSLPFTIDLILFIPCIGQRDQQHVRGQCILLPAAVKAPPFIFLTNRLLLYNCICIYEFIAFGCEYQIGLRPSLVSTCLLPSLYFPLSPLNGGNIWKSNISGVTFWIKQNNKYNNKSKYQKSD